MEPETSSNPETSAEETGTGEGETGIDEASGDESETGEPTNCEVTPGAWEAPDWDANTADALAVRAALDALTGDPLMRGIETGAVELEGIEDLTAAWEGDPNLSEIAHPGFVAIVEAVFAEFVDVIEAGEAELRDEEGQWAPGEQGGIWGDSDRGINEGGIEVRQFVDKGGISGGLMYAYAVGLTEGEITAATIDAIAAAWGSNATLDPEAEPTDAANYSYQMGFHGAMATALTDAKAYAADEQCQVERDAALVEFFNLWEQSMYARLVFYGNRAEGKLLAAVTGTEFADVLHDLGEGLGVAIGFYGMPDPAAGPLSGGARIISDDEIEAAAAGLGLDLADLGASTTGTFVESLPNLEAGVETVEGVVMEVYGLDAATIQSYAMPEPG